MKVGKYTKYYYGVERPLTIATDPETGKYFLATKTKDYGVIRESEELFDSREEAVAAAASDNWNTRCGIDPVSAGKKYKPKPKTKPDKKKKKKSSVVKKPQTQTKDNNNTDDPWEEDNTDDPWEEDNTDDPWEEDTWPGYAGPFIGGPGTTVNIKYETQTGKWIIIEEKQDKRNPKDMC